MTPHTRKRWPEQALQIQNDPEGAGLFTASLVSGGVLLRLRRSPAADVVYSLVQAITDSRAIATCKCSHPGTIFISFDTSSRTLTPRIDGDAASDSCAPCLLSAFNDICGSIYVPDDLERFNDFPYPISPL